jgi:hypothetical protein
MTPDRAGLTVYTWGYHGEIVETLEALRAGLNALIVDTRYVPSSRDARWRRPSLEKRFGPDYIWIKAFGNRNYKGGWTDPVILHDPEHGLQVLEPLVRPERPPLLLCMCPTPYCHRTDVATLGACLRVAARLRTTARRRPRG